MGIFDSDDALRQNPRVAAVQTVFVHYFHCVTSQFYGARWGLRRESKELSGYRTRTRREFPNNCPVATIRIRDPANRKRPPLGTHRQRIRPTSGSNPDDRKRSPSSCQYALVRTKSERLLSLSRLLDSGVCPTHSGALSHTSAHTGICPREGEGLEAASRYLNFEWAANNALSTPAPRGRCTP